MEPLISVAITTHNRLEDLENTLTQLERYKGKFHKLIVCADGCSDGTQAYIRENWPAITLIENNPGQGSIPSRNRMIRMAETPFVLLLDDDSYPIEDNFFEEAQEAMTKHQDIGVLTFPQRSEEFPESLSTESFGANLSVGTFTSSGSIIRKSLFEELGGFPDFFFHAYEEPDYSLRVHAKGFLIVQWSGLTVRHHFTQAMRDEGRTHRRHARNEFWSTIMRAPLGLLPFAAPYRILSQGRYAAKRGIAWLVREPSWWWQAIGKFGKALKLREPVSVRHYRSWIKLLRHPSCFPALKHQDSRAIIFNCRSGAGTDRDVTLLRELLQESGMSIKHITIPLKPTRFQRIQNLLMQLPSLLNRPDYQFHIEQLFKEQFWQSRNNYILPNPEFLDPRVFGKLPKKITVLCKTRHASQIFNNTSLESVFTGFTSKDSYRSDIKKDFRKFIHVVGSSPFKGTGMVVSTWRQNPHWPTLTILRKKTDARGIEHWKIKDADNINLIEDWISEERLIQLQNESGIHICPSEMEGFGHVIVEAMAVAGVAVTIDAPPMNEHITADCGFLVDCINRGPIGMSECYRLKSESLTATVETILRTPDEELEAMGKHARERYLQMDMNFRRRFTEWLGAI